MPADLGIEAPRSNRPREAIEILTQLDELTAPELFFTWDALLEAAHLVGQHAQELSEARRARAKYPDRLLLRNELRALAALGRVADVDGGVEESTLLPPTSHLDAGRFLTMRRRRRSAP